MSITKISNKPILILKNSSISEVIKKLLENNVSGLVVLDGNESIAEIISKTNITKAISK